MDQEITRDEIRELIELVQEKTGASDFEYQEEYRQAFLKHLEIKLLAAYRAR